MFPADRGGELQALAVEVLRRSSALGARLHPVTRAALVEHLRGMNSYYSNLIEGHATHPLDLERALRLEFSGDPSRRALQLESVAHVEVHRLLDARLGAEPALDVAAADTLCWIHRSFYDRLPESFREVGGTQSVAIVHPGVLRDRDVRVGHHVAPPSADVPRLLTRFREVYVPTLRTPLAGIVAGAAAHHRLAWIHPFLDGNGRVVRLFTDAWFARCGVDGHGLWTMSRGLARHRERYFAALANADMPRMGDLDGRGALSERMLQDFCRFFLEVALDQIAFMSGLLELEALELRIRAWVDMRASVRELKPEAFFLLRDVLLRGAVARGEAPRITGLPERTAREVLSALAREGLLVSETPKGPVRLAFPARVVGYWFPRLYPEGVEESLRSGTVP